jgi:DNA-binding Lrp family transcriptional regulator
MWEQIGAAAIYGAIGGGAGALIGAILATPFRRTRFAQMATTILTAAFVVIGIKVAEPILKPYIGEYLPQPASQDEVLEAYLVEMLEDPMAAAIFDKEPALEGELREKLQEILGAESRTDKIRDASFIVVRDMTESRFIYYLKRGRDEDLIAFINFMIEMMDYLTEAEPRFCHGLYYDPMFLATMSVEDIKAKMGADRQSRQQELAAAVIVNAFDEIPSYDVDAAQARLVEAGQLLNELLGQELIGLITVGGQKPQTDAEAAAACNATARLYKLLAESEKPGEAIRHIYTLSG